MSRSESVRKTWQNPERRVKQSLALKKCWQREDYRTRLSEHLRQISPKGSRELTRLRKSGAVTLSDESRKRMSKSQKLRFQRPEELKKLERARSLQVIDFQKRAQVMHDAFLRKYGSFLELAKMGMKAPKRKPSKLELEVARNLGDEWEYVGDGKLTIGGLVPDFIHKTRKEVLEVSAATITPVQFISPTLRWDPKLRRPSGTPSMRPTATRWSLFGSTISRREGSWPSLIVASKTLRSTRNPDRVRLARRRPICRTMLNTLTME